MKKFGDIMLGGRSGEKYCFQSWPMDARFRAVGAVFFVTKRLYKNRNFRRASHEVIYIGQTSNLADPLGTVSQRDAFEKHGANCVCVYAAKDEAQRVSIVEDLVAGHRPLMAT